MQTEWEERAMPRGKDESMPWHEGHVAFHKKALESADLYERHREREWRYEKRKDAFRREWEDMGVGADASKRYALARLIQAAFESVVGTRGITEDMPWTADLQRPESVSREDEGRERWQPRNTNSPLPGTSLETDYTHLRTEYIAFFYNRVRGEDREETERVAGLFREAWVREVGVRAHDVRMPWDEVLAQMEDGDVEQQEEEMDMVGGEVAIDVGGLRGRREGGRKGKGKGKKVEGWTRRRRDLGMEFPDPQPRHRHHLHPQPRAKPHPCPSKFPEVAVSTTSPPHPSLADQLPKSPKGHLTYYTATPEELKMKAPTAPLLRFLATGTPSPCHLCAGAGKGRIQRLSTHSALRAKPSKPNAPKKEKAIKPLPY
ncbi:hypothetical protein V498_06084, partial [Pseudogymnoascus sp. VKM F-4517 (FW-2822)]